MKKIKTLLILWLGVSSISGSLGLSFLFLAIVVQIVTIMIIDEINKPTYYNKIEQFVNDCEIK